MLDEVILAQSINFLVIEMGHLLGHPSRYGLAPEIVYTSLVFGVKE